MNEVRASIASGADPAAKIAGLDAALSLFVRNGVEATSVRDIATRSGFTNPAIFKHFESKTALALCLFERCYVWMSRAMAEAETEVGEGADAVTGILAIVRCGLHLMDDDIEAVLMVQDNLRRFWHDAGPATRSVSILGRLRRLIEVALDVKSPPGPGQPQVASALIASAIVGLLGQIAREAYFQELPGPASSTEAEICKIVLRLLNVEPFCL